MNIFKFFRKKKDPDITFWSAVRGLETVYPPVPAIEAIPDWFKQMPLDCVPGMNEHPGTAKRCPGLIDYFKQGYVVRLWCDLHLKINEDKSWEVKSPEQIFVFDNHLDNQFLDHIPNRNSFSMVLKAHCPWRMLTPPGWAVMQLPLFYNFNSDFTVLPGVVWTDIHHELNQQIAFHRYGEFHLKRGTPLAVYIPFKRTKLKHQISPITTDLVEKDISAYYWFASKFKGGYKEHQKIINQELKKK